MNWKIGFFVILLTLIATNVYWLYNTLDNVVGHSYYKDSCEPMFEDYELLIPLISQNVNRTEIRKYLESMKVPFDPFKKDGVEILVLNATEIIFNNDLTIKSIKSFR